MVGVEGDDLTQKLVVAIWGLCWYNFVFFLQVPIGDPFHVQLLTGDFFQGFLDFFQPASSHSSAIPGLYRRVLLHGSRR